MKNVFALALVLSLGVVGCGGGSAVGGIGTPSTEVRVISPTGSTVFASQGRVKLEAPAGAVSAAIAIGITRNITAPQTVNFVKNSAYSITPNDTTFQGAITVTLQYDPTQIPAGSAEGDLVLARLNGNTWQPVAGSTVDPTSNSVTADMTTIGTIGVIDAN